MKKIFLLFCFLSIATYAEISIGDNAKDFTLKTLDTQKEYHLKDLRGNVVLLNLWASWCKGCKKEMPEFFKLQKSYKKGFKIVTVSVDDNVEKASKYLKNIAHKKGYDTPFIALHDREKNVAKVYECEALPSSYLIDKHGVIQEVMIGSLNTDDIKQLKTKINTLLK